MRQGRPAMKAEFRSQILKVLADAQYPVTVVTVKRLLDARRSRPCGWHTVHKYLQELASERLVLRQALPPHRGRKPLIVYMDRPGANR